MSKWADKTRAVQWIADHPESTANILAETLSDTTLLAVELAMFPAPTADDADSARRKAIEILKLGGLTDDSDEIKALTNPTAVTLEPR